VEKTNSRKIGTEIGGSSLRGKPPTVVGVGFVSEYGFGKRTFIWF
jgi:hypothetical protein